MISMKLNPCQVKMKKLMKHKKRIQSARHKKTMWKDDTLKEIVVCLDLIEDVMEKLKVLDTKIK